MNFVKMLPISTYNKKSCLWIFNISSVLNIQAFKPNEKFLLTFIEKETNKIEKIKTSQNILKILSCIEFN